MSRSGYVDSDDCNGFELGRWRSSVRRAIRGKRGQQALREILDALDAMPVKELAAESLITEEGEFCTLGVLGKARGVDIETLDPDDPDQVAAAFNIAPAMAREIVYENDEYIYGYEYKHIEICGPVRWGWPDFGKHIQTVRIDIDPNEVAHRRWQHMRNWVQGHLVKLEVVK